MKRSSLLDCCDALRNFAFSRTRASVLVVGLLGCFSVGCGGELPSPARVDKLRLLSLQADLPEIPPGTDVNVRALWFDGSTNRGRPVYFRWAFCPMIIDQEPRNCLLPSRSTELLSGTADQNADRVQIPGAMFALGNGQNNTNYAVVLALCPDQPPMFSPEISQYICPSEQSLPNDQREGIQSFRRIVVRAQGPYNQNPSIARIEVNGQPVTDETIPINVTRCADPSTCEGVRITVFAAEGSAEPRLDQMSIPETLLTSFFFTKGRVDRPRAVPSEGNPTGMDGSLSVKFFPPNEAVLVHAWMVLRDGRGGDTSRALLLNVQ